MDCTGYSTNASPFFSWIFINKLLLMHSCCLSGYVDEIKRLLFSIDKSQMHTMSTKYGDLVPPPLNTQFLDRLSKEEAVKRNNQKQEGENNPFSIRYILINIEDSKWENNGLKYHPPQRAILILFFCLTIKHKTWACFVSKILEQNFKILIHTFVGPY